MYASDYRLRARQNLAGNWWLSVAVTLVACLLGGYMGTGFGFNLNINIDSELMDIVPEFFRELVVLLGPLTVSFSYLGLVQLILGGVIELGYCRYLLNQHDHREMNFSDLFSRFDQFGAGFCLRLLTTLFTMLWSLLLIIPGIIASYSYAMAPYIMTEHPEYSATECIKKSKEMMYGHKFALFCLDFSFIGWAILSAFTFGIGILFLNPYQAAARAAFYREISKEAYVTVE